MIQAAVKHNSNDNPLLLDIYYYKKKQKYCSVTAGTYLPYFTYIP
jgi:hypothetical protein